MVISAATLFLSSLTLLLAVANALLVSSSHSSATSINKGIRNRIRIRGGDNGNNSNGIRNIKNKNPSSLLSQQQHQNQHGMITDSTAAATTTNANTDLDTDSDSDSSQSHVPNVFPKEEKELSFIKEVLRANFLFQDFSSIHDEDQKGNVVESPGLSTVVGSFEKYTYKRGTVLCTQGDSADTDYLYLIASGSCSVCIDGEKLPDPYGTMGEGSLIGDLAMLYGTARAATVRCQTDVTVYRLHRTDFYHFLDQNSTSSNSNVDVDVDNYNDYDTVSARQKEIQQQVKEIDEVIDQISGVKSKYDGSIIRQFQPERYWLWSRWRGTILQHAWKTAAMNMLVSLFFLAGLRLANNHIFNNPITWPVGEYRDTECCTMALIHVVLVGGKDGETTNQ